MLGGPPLGHVGGLHVQRAIEQALGAVVHEAAHHVRQRGAFGQLEARVLEIDHTLAEGLPLLRVCHGDLHRALDDRGGGHGQQHALEGQLAHELRKTLAFRAAQQVGRGRAHAVEKQFTGVRRMQAHLLQDVGSKARQLLRFQHEQRDALAAFAASAHHHDQQVGGVAVGDEDLAAVDHVVVALAAGAGADGFEVGAGAGLGHGDAGDQLAAGQPGQPALFLFLGAIVQDVVRGNGVHGHRAGDFGARQFVGHHQLVGQAGAGAAIGFGQLGQQETQRTERAPDLARDVTLLAPASEVRQQFGVHVTTQLVAEGFDVRIHPGVAVQLRQHGVPWEWAGRGGACAADCATGLRCR